jgi:hypothetical protein
LTGAETFGGSAFRPRRLGPACVPCAHAISARRADRRVTMSKRGQNVPVAGVRWGSCCRSARAAQGTDAAEFELVVPQRHRAWGVPGTLQDLRPIRSIWRERTPFDGGRSGRTRPSCSRRSSRSGRARPCSPVVRARRSARRVACSRLSTVPGSPLGEPALLQRSSSRE